MVLSFDAKGIAMLHRDLREATRKAAEATPHERLPALMSVVGGVLAVRVAAGPWHM